MANIHQAKTNLSSLIAAVLAGKDVVIAKSGAPVARLIQYIPNKTKRIPGLFKGKIWMSDKFTEKSKEINKMFSLE
jgi:prevent-host-death family protein